MKFLVTGGCGFLGSNLAKHVMDQGHELFVLDNLFRFGSEQNLNWLRACGDFKFYHADIRSYNDVEYVIRDVKPEVIFHLAGQVAMTTSLVNPRLDFEINVLGGHNVLEAVRKFVPEAIVTYSSTNKVYGDLEQLQYIETPTRYIAKGYEQGFDENLPLNFQSPYGCSKGATDQYMLDYARMFGVRTIVFRHSSIFGGRQFSTFDQGWIGWFVSKAIESKKTDTPFTISGTGKQVRDVLFIDDLIRCYFGAINNIDKTKGQAYNMGGGIENSLSLLELFNLLEKILDVHMHYTKIPERASDQKVFVAQIGKLTHHIGWRPEVDKIEGIRRMINWVGEQK